MLHSNFGFVCAFFRDKDGKTFLVDALVVVVFFDDCCTVALLTISAFKMGTCKLHLRCCWLRN